MHNNQFGYEANPYQDLSLPLAQQQQALAQGNFAGVQPRTRLVRVTIFEI